MASGSPRYVRIRDHVLSITTAIPVGRVTTFQAIGEHLDVMPRHVAYILATLAEPLASVVPWYRVVPESGKLSRSKREMRMESLSAEGVELSPAGEIVHFLEKYVAPTDLTSGVAKQHRSEAITVTRRR